MATTTWSVTRTYMGKSTSEKYETREEAIEALIEEMKWLARDYSDSGACDFFEDQASIEREIKFRQECDKPDTRVIQALKNAQAPCLISIESCDIVAGIDLSEECPSFAYDTKEYRIEKFAEEE